MALQEQTINIPFALGLDRKSDKWQIPRGRFYNLINSVFTKSGRLTKRNGNEELTTLPDDSDPLILETYQKGLVEIGNSIDAYSTSNETWTDKGIYQPLSISAKSLIRNTTPQQQSDVAVAPNGLTCVVYTNGNYGIGLNTFPAYEYAVFDSDGAALVNPTTIPTAYTGGTSNAIGSPRVFVLGNFFVVVFLNEITATFHLQYFAIPVNDPTNPTGAVNISSSYDPSTVGLSFDGVVANNNLYLAWNGGGGTGIDMTYIDSTLVQHNTTNPDPTNFGTTISVTADTSQTTAVIWVTYYDSGAKTGWTLAVNQALTPVLAPTQIISSGVINNITSSATGMVNTIFYEVNNTYYSSGYQINFIETVTVTQAGVVGTATDFVRSVGLGAKSFLYQGNVFVVGIYQSPNQSTYFIFNSLGDVVGKIAYANAFGYYTLGLPSAVVMDTTVTIGYLFAFQIQSVSKSFQNPFTSFFETTGVNATTLNFDVTPITAEIGKALHISGAQLWMYDSINVVEHGFHLWPELPAALTAVWHAGTFATTGTTTSTSKVVTAVASTVGVLIGMAITDANGDIPGGTLVENFTSNTITLSQAATGSHAGQAITLGQNGGGMVPRPDGATNTKAYYYQYLYKWIDAQGNVHRSAPSIPVFVTTSGSGSNGFATINIPVLHITLKTGVAIEVYRWSVGQQVPYELGPLLVPIYNSGTAGNPDIIAVTDTSADSAILGNPILYTFGGTLENIGAPATDILSLYDSRLWLIPSETPNEAWYSQTVLEATPVETSDELTYEVSPTLGAQGNTGPISAIAPLDDKFIFYKPSAAMYYLTGEGPDATGANSGYSPPILIATTTGCTNPRIALTPNGHIFQSDKGIWQLGRNLQTSYIGSPVEDFSLNATVLSSFAVPETTQIRFLMSGGITLMYDYFYGEWGTFMGINAVAGTIYQGLQCSLDAFGRVLLETPGKYLDVSNPVLMSFTTSWIALGGIQGYQRARWAFLLGQYLSPHKLIVGIAYDFNSAVQQQVIITPDNYAAVYGGLPFYGGGDFYGGPGDVEEWQIAFKRQTCQSFQLTVTEQYDPSFSQPAGAGLTLSGIDLVVGVKKGFPRQLPASRKTG